MNYEFERVAIVNRGEAAMRFIHAAREFNQEHGTSLRTIALFTDCERHAMFVREADEAFCLGPTRVLDPNTQQCKSSYVDYARLQRALAAARAEAVWVGWGFVAEQAAFADLCRRNGHRLHRARRRHYAPCRRQDCFQTPCRAGNVPVAPWSGGPVETMDEALGMLPSRLSSADQSHRRRWRAWHSQSISEYQLRTHSKSARSEAFKAFGDPQFFWKG